MNDEDYITSLEEENVALIAAYADMRDERDALQERLDGIDNLHEAMGRLL